ncbi:MAG: tagaturonate epimerase family protein [Proteobacteria bacterium]|nr:tagaturonate epimerase family protein [Pseudomonadota bacterium]
MPLNKYSMGIGDRFSRQGKAQLTAIIKAKELGVDVTPVWNKSHREHSIVKTVPQDVRIEADEAVKGLDWDGAYFVDADHINLNNVDSFLEASDFFTIDVADYIGNTANQEQQVALINAALPYVRPLKLPGIKEEITVTKNEIESITDKYLSAVLEAGKIYRYIESKKGKGTFITEISMDETDYPQSPVELLFILLGLATEKIPVQTIAPKFSGRFNKGVDYSGDPKVFAEEFNQDLAALSFAVEEFGLPDDLKLSIHSGSDKFSIYPLVAKAIKNHDVGLHLKTAGTTWLEELIGLAESGEEGLAICKEIYISSLSRFEELCTPYKSVIDINPAKLPSKADMDKMDSQRFVNSLRHDPNHPDYNIHLRQLLHVGYKVASELGERYYDALAKFETTVAKNVTENILERHIKQVFL